MPFSPHLHSVSVSSLMRSILGSRGGTGHCKQANYKHASCSYPQQTSARSVAVYATPAEYIAVAEEKMAANDMMGALRQFELALSDADLPIDLQRKLLFNTCTIHANFGDLELAQIPLRKAITMGLEFEETLAAAQAQSAGMVPVRAPTQILISLKKFARVCKANVREERPAYNPTKGLQLTPAGVRTAMAQDDIQELVGTEMKGAGMDKSLGGIFKRVALLLSLLVFGGVGLFYLGLKLAFPDGI